MKFKTLIAAAIMAVTISARAQVFERTIVTGIPYVTAGATSNALSSAYLEVKNHDEVFVQYRAIMSATNNNTAAAASAVVFGVSQFPSNFVPVCVISNTINSTANADRDMGTNIYIGSAKYFAVMAFVNNGTNTTATNKSITGTAGTINLQFKGDRSRN